MLSRQEEEQERRETLENDRRVREQQKPAPTEAEILQRIVARSRTGLRGQQGSTYMDHTDEQVPGRFAALGNPQVTGQAPAQQWPKLPSSSPWSGLPPDEPNRDDPPRDARDPLNVSAASAGRFAVLGQPHVVGSSPRPWYPPARGQRDPCGPEPPLGFDNPALEPEPLSHSPAQQLGDPADAPPGYETPSGDWVSERAGSSPLPKGPNKRMIGRHRQRRRSIRI